MSDKIIQTEENAFNGVIAIIDNARESAFRAVNRELINMYWNIGEYVSRRVSDSDWGKSTVKEFSVFIQNRYIGINGFSAANIWRMKQFYETYHGKEKLVSLIRELPWTHNLRIMPCKTDEEREFYLTLSVKNRYTSRELVRQMDSGLYERTMLSDIHNKLIHTQNKDLIALRDSYVLEFLDLPEKHSEKDLRRAIVGNLKKFILEFGKDFALKPSTAI